MNSVFFLGLFGVIVLGLAGGQIANMNGRSFWLGALIGLLANIPGLLILAYIGSSNSKKTFNPDFANHNKNKAAEINELSRLHQEGKLTDKEFEKLKREIIDGER